MCGKIQHTKMEVKMILTGENVSTSESIGNLLPAWFKVMQEVEPVNKTKFNKIFNSRYATLDDIQAATDPILFEHGLFLTHLLETREGIPGVNSILFHADSIEFISAWVGMEAKGVNKAQTDIQALGANVTYIKRYARASLFGVMLNDDDDGNRSQQKPTRKKETVTKKETPEEYQQRVYEAIVEKLDFSNVGEVKTRMKELELTPPTNEQEAKELFEKLNETTSE